MCGRWHWTWGMGSWSKNSFASVGHDFHCGSMEQAFIEGEQPSIENEHAAGEDCEPEPLIAGITGQAVGGIKTTAHGRPTHQKKRR